MILATRIFLIAALVCSAVSAAYDPTHGATNFVFVPEGHLWHPVGPAKLITTWSGPFSNTGGHPGNIYMVFSKEPQSATELNESLPSNVRVVHSLGLDFYYPAGAKPGPDPADLGYTASGFDIGDKLVNSFPAITGLFPSGIRTSGCKAANGDFFLLLGKRSGAAYLVWSQSGGVPDVAYVPATLLHGDLNGILDNLSYYQNGGMAEIMRFSALFYYLSRLPLSDRLGATAALPRCPETPEDTPTGIVIPNGWTQAVKVLK